MQDQDKNREQLIGDLNEMRRRVAELETAETRATNQNRRPPFSDN